jgi:hypothetical protein
MPKSGGIDWVLLLIVAGILVFIGISIWALLRFRKSRKETPSATFHGTVMWPRGRAGGMAAPKPGTPPQAPEQHEGTVMWPKGQAARAASRPPAPLAPPPPAPEQPEGTVMWPKGQAARAASRPPAPFTPSAPSAPPASQPPAPEEAEGTVMWPKGRAARAASGPPAAPVPPAPLAEPERQGSFFGALIRKCLPAKKPAPQTFSETVMYPRERGGRTAPESRAPSFQPPATPPRVDPGGPGTFSAPAPKEDPGWAMRLPPAPPRAAEASEAAPQAPGMTIQEEVEFLRRQLREMQARQDGSTSQPAPPQTPPEDPRRFP